MTLINNHNWGVFEKEGLLVHIAPLEDTQLHVLDDVDECDCCPDYYDEGLVIHNSFDGREQYGAIN